MTYRPIPKESYPQILNKSDIITAKLLCKLYTGEHGELKSILQFKYHIAHFNKRKFTEVSSILEKIITEDLSHLDLLAKTLISLGVDPIYTERPNDKYKFFSTANLSYTNVPKQMLFDDIAQKIQSVRTYKQVLANLKNPEIYSLINQIKTAEDSHLAELKNLNAKIFSNKKGAPYEDPSLIK